MPPDADKLRQRGGGTTSVVKNNGAAGAAAAGAEVSTQGERLSTLANIKTTEVCIDGVIYDIANFDHPGGNSILMFGGNDVTVQYNMIHPYHTDKHLEKMRRVGKVVDYVAE
jgi:acyl-lipid (7-3)-desaturase (Delta-4 desaturase)